MWNIPVYRYEGGCASSTVVVRDAFLWVASGFYDIVMAAGTERNTAMGTTLATRAFAMGSDSRYK
jgi:acetyl-CoA C-acetyltransferase/acetyl-CoA acyltransferase